MRSSMEEIKLLLRSKKKCIWVKTYEEHEFINDLKAVILDDEKMCHMEIYEWSHTSGAKRVQRTLHESDSEVDPKLAPFDRLFANIRERQDANYRDENVFVMKDAHLLNDAHQFKRALRDIKEHNPKNYNPIIIVSPTLNIPLEHEKLFEVVDYALPDDEEIRRLVGAAVAKIKKEAASEIKEKGLGEYVVPTEKTVEDVIEACKGLTKSEILDSLLRSIVKDKTLSVKTMLDQKISLVKKTGILEYVVPSVKFEDIGGNKAFKEWIEEIEDTRTKEAIEFGCKPAKGYLALGIPGSSKTAMAEAIASRWNLPLLKFQMSNIMSKLVGDSEKKVEQAFRIAKACAPCVILFDEIEKLLSGVNSSHASDAGTTSRVFAEVLAFLNSDSGVFSIMTSNDVSKLPPELTRMGRLDGLWYFAMLSREERAEIFKIHFSKRGKEVADELIEVAAKDTKNYTGAEIEQIVIASIRKAFKRYKVDGNKEITADDINRSVKEIIPLYKSYRESIAFLESWVQGRARYSNDIQTENIEENDESLLQILKLD